MSDPSPSHPAAAPPGACTVLLNADETNWNLRLGDWREFAGVHPCGRPVVGESFGIALCVLHHANGQTPVGHVADRLGADIEDWLDQTWNETES